MFPLGDVASLGNQQDDRAPLIPDRLQGKIDVVHSPNRVVMSRVEPDDFAGSGGGNRFTQTLLQLGRMRPPRRIPKRLTDHGFGPNSGKLQGSPVDLQQDTVQRHQADELKRLVEDGPEPVLGGGQPFAANAMITRDLDGE